MPQSDTYHVVKLSHSHYDKLDGKVIVFRVTHVIEQLGDIKRDYRFCNADGLGCSRNYPSHDDREAISSFVREHGVDSFEICDDTAIVCIDEWQKAIGLSFRQHDADPNYKWPFANGPILPRAPRAYENCVRFNSVGLVWLMNNGVKFHVYASLYDLCHGK